MFYEKKLGSLQTLLKELQILDLDAGIRIVGKHQGKQCFVFVTRSAGGYAVMAYGMKREGKESVPERRLFAKELPNAQETWEFISQSASKPLKAFAY